MVGGCESGDSGEEEEGKWRYREHPQVASWSDREVQKMRSDVSECVCVVCVAVTV